mgnify:CR=1 FL=1
MDFRIKELCKEKGLLFKELAQQLGITDVGLRQSLQGNPTIGTLEKIAAVLGVSIPELFVLNQRTRSPARIAVNRSNLKKGNSRMKKRLRKKLHKGEFRELGFELDYDYTGDLEGEPFDQFWGDWIRMIESLGLECGGGGAGHQNYFIIKYRGSVSVEQRQAVIDWLGKHPDIANVTAGQLRDAWYG